MLQAPKWVARMIVCGMAATAMIAAQPPAAVAAPAQPAPVSAIAASSHTAAAIPETGAHSSAAMPGADAARTAARKQGAGAVLVETDLGNQFPGGGIAKAIESGLSSPRLFHLAEGTLIGTAAFDMAMTARGVTHPPILRLTVVDNGLTGYTNLNFSSSFREGGWAGFASAHNAPLLIALYAGEDILLTWTVRHFVTRNPRWRALGTLALLAQAWVHIEAGRSWVGLGQRLAAPYAQFNPVWVR